MARRRYFRRSPARRLGYFSRARRFHSAPKKHSVINILAAVLALMGIGIPVANEMWARHAAKRPFLGTGGVLEGAGDALGSMFLGRHLDGSADSSGLKYTGWYVVGGALGMVLVNKLISGFAGHVRIWKNWSLN